MQFPFPAVVRGYLTSQRELCSALPLSSCTDFRIQVNYPSSHFPSTATYGGLVAWPAEHIPEVEGAHTEGGSRLPILNRSCLRFKFLLCLCFLKQSSSWHSLSSTLPHPFLPSAALHGLQIPMSSRLMAMGPDSTARNPDSWVPQVWLSWSLVLTLPWIPEVLALEPTELNDSC